MATIDILGVPHSYELTAPTASPCTLVFVHGWLLSRAYWHPVIAQLARDYQCLSYDLRGFGASQPLTGGTPIAESAIPVSPSLPLATIPDPDTSRAFYPTSTSTLVSPSTTAVETATLTDMAAFSPAAYARDLGLLLDHLQLDQVWLVGHSLGGAIALWLAAQRPEQVKGVLCVNAGGGIYIKEEFEQFRSAGEQMLKFRPQWLSQLPLLDVLFARMNVAQPVQRSWGRQRLIDFVSANFTAAAGALLDSTTEEEVHKLPQVVSRLNQPVYFLAGTEDTIMQPKYVRHLASFHSLFESCGENVIDIENCGHLAMVEQPDQVAAHVRSLLTQYGYAS